MPEQLTLFAADTPASPFQQQERERAQRMKGISGRKCLELYAVAGRDGSLPKMLVDILTSVSTRLPHHWKLRASPSGRLLFQLVPSGHGTDETDCGLWLTPTATAIDERSDEALMRRQEFRQQSGRETVPPGNLAEQVSISDETPRTDMRASHLWPTPTVGGGGQTLPEGTTPTGQTPEGRKQTVCLERYAMNVERGLWPTPDIRGFTNKGALQMLAKKTSSREEWAQMSYRTSTGVREKMWPTPRASDCADGRLMTADGQRTNKAGTKLYGPQLSDLVKLFPTPRANDAEKRGEIANDPRNGLPAAAKYWPTPTSSMRKGSSAGAMTRNSGRSRENDRLDYAAERGQTASGRLNPLWVEWLMGYPIEWTGLERSETQSSRKSRRSSARRS